jgi:hypothetical protein
LKDGQSKQRDQESVGGAFIPSPPHCRNGCFVPQRPDVFPSHRERLRLLKHDGQPTPDPLTLSIMYVLCCIVYSTCTTPSRERERGFRFRSRQLDDSKRGLLHQMPGMKGFGRYSPCKCVLEGSRSGALVIRYRPSMGRRQQVPTGMAQEQSIEPGSIPYQAVYSRYLGIFTIPIVPSQVCLHGASHRARSSDAPLSH